MKIDYLKPVKFDKNKRQKHQNIGKFYVKVDMVDDKMFYNNKLLIKNIMIIYLILNNILFHYQTKLKNKTISIYFLMKVYFTYIKLIQFLSM